MKPAVEMDGVWKKFRTGQVHDSLRDWIPALVRRAFSGTSDELDKKEFWALRDVSFRVDPGEALAIIGPNGAGKSTTLKTLSRILRPDRGQCQVTGRVGALIEVAAGFHPDLTGRENIFLQGAIMGMHRVEIRRRFDEIVDFADVSAFIDTPVKRYSSGMHARLGFSIAAHLDPDVLLIDEVLSVGDMDFQQKCIQRAKTFKARGVAIVFVSHNLQAVSDLCERSVYLARGIKAQGETSDVLASYLRDLSSEQVETGPIEIVSSKLLDASGAEVSQMSPGARLTLRITLRARETVDYMRFGFLLYRSTDNLKVYDRDLSGEEVGVTALDAGEVVTLDLGFVAHLSRGQFHVLFYVADPRSHTRLATLQPAALLTVHDERSYGGVADIELSPRIASMQSTLAVAAGAEKAK